MAVTCDEAEPLLAPGSHEAKFNSSECESISHEGKGRLRTTSKHALAWIVTVLVLFHTLYFGLLRMSALPQLVKHLTNTQVSKLELENEANDESAKLWGQMSCVQSLCALLAEPLWGIVSDKYGRRRALIGNAAGMIVSSSVFTAVALTLQIPNETFEYDGLRWAVLWLGAIALGCTSSFLTITSAAVSDISAPEDVAANFGLWGMALCLGSFVGPLLHNGLSAIIPPWLVFSVVTVCWLLLALLIAFCVPETNTFPFEHLPAPVATGSYGEARAVSSQLREQVLHIVRIVFMYPPTALLCAVNILFGFGMEGFYTIYWFSFSQKGFDTATTNSIYSAYSIFQGCVEAILLRILVHCAPEISLLTIGLTAISGAFFGLSGAYTLPAAVSSLALLSLGTGLTYPLLYGLTSRHIKDYQPHDIGAGMAAFRVVCIVAEVTGQLTSSALFHSQANKGAVWIVAGASVGLGAVLCGLFAWYELVRLHRRY